MFLLLLLLSLLLLMMMLLLLVGWEMRGWSESLDHINPAGACRVVILAKISRAGSFESASTSLK